MQPTNVNERTIERINAVLKDHPNEEDRRVLTYVKGQISEAGVEKRPEHDKSVIHLIETANQRCARHERMRAGAAA